MIVRPIARLLGKKRRMEIVFNFLLEQMLEDNTDDDCSVVINLIVWDRTAKRIEVVKKQDGWYEATLGKKPCEDKNSNVCVAEGCFGEACLKDPPIDDTWIDEQMTKDAKGITHMSDEKETKEAADKIKDAVEKADQWDREAKGESK
jgi:hypothetical protein